MPISSMVEFFKVVKAHLLLTLRYPADEKTSDTGTEAMTGMVCEASKTTPTVGESRHGINVLW